MNKKYFVSVIIPNFNHAKYLDERIQSVLNQTYRDFEIIILDDASTDNSLDVIDKYRNSSQVSQIIVNKQNSGSPFFQWNKGLKFAKGDLIWIAESDDSCHLDMLENLVSCFEKDEKLSFAFCRSIQIDAKSKQGNICGGHRFTKDFNIDGYKFNHNYMMSCNRIGNASSVVFKKEYALSIDPQYIKYKGAGDWLFWIEMAERGRVALLSKPMNYFRKHNTNTTAIMQANGIEDIEDKKIYDYFVDHSYCSLWTKISLKKRNVRKIKYTNSYKDEQIRMESLKLWNPNILIIFLAYLSYKIIS